MVREDKQVKQHYYEIPPRNHHTLVVYLSCTLDYFIFGLSANMGGTVISCDSEVIKC